MSTLFRYVLGLHKKAFLFINQACNGQNLDLALKDTSHAIENWIKQATEHYCAILDYADSAIDKRPNFTPFVIGLTDSLLILKVWLCWTCKNWDLRIFYDSSEPSNQLNNCWDRSNDWDGIKYWAAYSFLSNIFNLIIFSITALVKFKWTEFVSKSTLPRLSYFSLLCSFLNCFLLNFLPCLILEIKLMNKSILTKT